MVHCMYPSEPQFTMTRAFVEPLSGFAAVKTGALWGLGQEAELAAAAGIRMEARSSSEIDVGLGIWAKVIADTKAREQTRTQIFLMTSSPFRPDVEPSLLRSARHQMLPSS